MTSAYVVDTHALIWYLTDSSHLSSTARSILERSEIDDGKLLIPTIVLAEILGTARKGTVPWPEALAALFKIDTNASFEVIPFSWEDVRQMTGWLYTRSLDSSGMHDLIILATADRSQAPLVTADKDLRAQTVVETIW